jgi:hypothetical protein
MKIIYLCLLHENLPLNLIPQSTMFGGLSTASSICVDVEDLLWIEELDLMGDSRGGDRGKLSSFIGRS